MRLEATQAVPADGGLVDGWNANEGATSKVRFVRLTRRKGDSFGFHLRGGREHGTGFFISHVEPNSEALLQGLRAGDQVLRVNQMSVEGAVHKEVAAMVQSSGTVILQVKGAGIIPIKDSRPRYLSKQKHPCSSSTTFGRHRRRGDPLTWLMVEDDPYGDPSSQSLHGGTSIVGSELEYIPNHRHQEGPGYMNGGSQGSESPNGASLVSERVIINVNKEGLGCSICKGPAEKPGIYVQSVKAGGVARESGLRAGDLILACNNTPFTRLQFQEAVYVLKSCNRLVLDVVHGAGLELVTGESSGYNSSASSIAGDQTPPSGGISSGSSADHQRPYSGHDLVTNRLSAVRKHLQLDTNRGWREIEAEWASAEAEEKRKQLNHNQKLLKTQKQRDALHNASLNAGTISGSQSLSNLLNHNEDDDGEACTVFREGPITTKTDRHKSRKYNTVLHKPLLRSTRSTSDVRVQGGNHKIALVTSRDPHVNNIVITEGPKDEKDALSRLDQLSSTGSSSRLDSTSSAASLNSMSSHNTSNSVSRLDNLTKNAQMSAHGVEYSHRNSHSKSAEESPLGVEEQMRRLRQEQNRLREEAERLQEERRKFEEEKRGLLRSHSVPLAPLVIQCSGPSVLSSPSPTPSSSSGRHTSKILIRSSPPAPPPRDTSTALSGKLRRHHRGEQLQGPHNNYCHHQLNQLNNHSPPSSPSASIASSSGVASSCSSYGGAPPRRCKSIGSLSESSGEGTIWEDGPSEHSTAYLSQNLDRTGGLSSSSSTLISLGLYDNQSNKSNYSSSNNQFLTNDSIRQLIPPPPTLPKPSKTLSSTISGTTNNSSILEEQSSRTSVSTGAPPPPPPPPAPASRSSSNLANALSLELERRTSKEARGTLSEEARARAIEDKIHNYKKEKKAQHPLKAQHDQLMEEFKMAHQRMFSGKNDDGDDDGDSDVINVTSNPIPQQAQETNHPNEHRVDVEKQKSQSSTPVSASSPRKDFLYKKAPATAPKPPETYFDHSVKSGLNKPLVLIESYPDPSQRPQPKRMDFLHGTVNAVHNKEHIDMPTRDDLQSELCNTLKRSNLRQRGHQDKSNSSSNQITLTDDTNGDQQFGPSSLSEKYQSLGISEKKPSVSIIVKGIDDLTSATHEDCYPAGILKPAGPPRHHLHKSISFGDVTSMGDEVADRL